MTTKNIGIENACERSRKLNENNEKMMYELSVLQQFNETVSPTVRCRKQKKNKSSIYDFLKEFRSFKNEKTEVKTFPDFSNELWRRTGSFDGSYKLDETDRKFHSIETHPDGDIDVKNTTETRSKSSTRDRFVRLDQIDGKGVKPLNAYRNQKENTQELSIKNEGVSDENLKLKASVKSYQALMEKRKEEILSLQESMCYQNREIQKLRQTLQQYQKKASDVRSNAHAMEREIASLKQVLKAETEKSANLKKNNDSKLEVIDQLSRRLQLEQEKCKRISELEKQLKTENEGLNNKLNLERETNSNLEKELEGKQTQINQLVAQLKAGKTQLSEMQKQTQDMSDFIREEQQLKDELTAAKNQMLQLTNKKERELKQLHQEKEQLKIEIAQQSATIIEKTNIIEQLKRQIDELETKVQAQNTKFNDITQSLMEKQNQLMNVNKRLGDANSSFEQEKTHIKKTLTRLELTHKKVLMDLKKLLTSFKRQLISKYKENENLKKRLMKREVKFNDNVQQMGAVDKKASGEDLSSISNSTISPSPLRSIKSVRKKSKNIDANKNLFSWKRKKMKGRINKSGHSLLSNYTPISFRSSALSFRGVRKSFSKQKFCCEASVRSERGDSSSVDGFESSGTVSTFRKLEKLQATWIPHYNQIQPFKPDENYSDFLTTLSLYHTYNLRNLYSTFINVNPALINLGMSHFLSQIDKIQGTNNFYSNLFRKNGGGEGTSADMTLDDLTQALKKTNCGSVPKSTARKPTDSLETASKSNHDFRTINTTSEKSFSFSRQNDEKTIYELLILLCSNLYKTVSKMVSDS